MAWLELTSQVCAGRLSEGVSSHIFSFLSTPQDLVRCQATCRNWKNSVAVARPRYLIIETIWLVWTGSGQLVRWLAKHKTLFQHVREVIFTFARGLDSKFWEVVLLSANHMESLIVMVSHARASFLTSRQMT